MLGLSPPRPESSTCENVKLTLVTALKPLECHFSWLPLVTATAVPAHLYRLQNLLLIVSRTLNPEESLPIYLIFDVSESEKLLEHCQEAP